jgi:competence protein ComEC
LPGAVGRVPAIPTSAFALMVVGGLWVALWSRRWRVLGVAPIAIGVLLAPYGGRPDVLIGRGGDLIAVRGEDGKLSALAQRSSSFELARWLEHDADARTPAEVGRAEAFVCDPQGCVATVKGVRVAVASTAAALRDDCRLAGVLVFKSVRPEACNAPRMIDADALAARGAHSLTIADGKVRIETVADSRGVRPWAPAVQSEDFTDGKGNQ